MYPGLEKLWLTPSRFPVEISDSSSKVFSQVPPSYIEITFRFIGVILILMFK